GHIGLLTAVATLPQPVHQRRRVEIGAHARQPIFVTRRAHLIRMTMQNAFVDERAQTGSQRRAIGAGRLDELLEAARAEEDLAQHERGPAITERLERHRHLAAAQDCSGTLRPDTRGDAGDAFVSLRLLDGQLLHPWRTIKSVRSQHHCNGQCLHSHLAGTRALFSLMTSQAPPILRNTWLVQPATFSRGVLCVHVYSAMPRSSASICTSMSKSAVIPMAPLG